jgi:hypothetical protein
MGSVADDRWHVRMAPGEVKVLTLDQIDDLFRLDLIDGDTLVRQDGTEQWLPLRVVAGLDDLDEEANEQAAPAPPPARSAPPPAVRSAPPPPPPVRSAPPPAVRSAPPPPPAPLPPPDTAAPFTHSPSFVPPPAAARSMPPSAPPPLTAPPPLVIARPAPLPFTPRAAPTRASRVESLLIGLAVLLGLVLTLHRNGVVAALAESAGQSPAYTKLEATLGGPAPGTPRAVTALVNATQSPSRH